MPDKVLYCFSVEENSITYALVAQLDRVFDYESKGRGFEPLQARQSKILSSQDDGIFALYYSFLVIMNNNMISRTPMEQIVFDGE